MITILKNKITADQKTVRRYALWKSAAHPRRRRTINHYLRRADGSYIQNSESEIPVGIPWQETIGKMYGILANHYGVDLRML